MNKEETNFQCSSLFIFGCSCLLSFVALLFSMQIRFPSTEKTKYLPIIPTTYSVNENYLVPQNDDNVDASNTFYSALISLFESYLKFEGIYKGKFSSNSYCKLSRESIIETVQDKCMNIENSICDLQFDSTTVLQYFKTIQGLNESITIKSNKEKHLEFTTKETKFSRSSEGIKELLFMRKRPVILSMPNILADYYTPCRTAENDVLPVVPEECSEKELRCPSFIKEEYCGLVSAPAFLHSGDFFVPKFPALPRAGDSISFEVLGYNNYYVPQATKHFISSHSLPRGGFIVKGNGPGHTIDYLLGKKSAEYDRSKCSNSNNPNTWKPCRNPNCTNENLLVCTDESQKYCVKGDNYALVSEMTESKLPIVIEKSTGLTVTYLYHINKQGTVENKIKISSIPFTELGRIFTPKVTSKVNKECGYWFIPYELVNLAASIEQPGISSTLGLDFPIRFETFPSSSEIDLE